ncbi:MAG: hypothetical protein P8Z37_19630, partial [Acidobacteriota bacterium]
MRKAALLFIIMCFALTAFGGFKAKKVKAKKPGQFQCMVTVSGVTYAADLLLAGKEQKKYFNDALTPSNIIAVRLAVFNDSKEEVVLPLMLPLNDLRLMNAKGFEFVRIDPETVAQAVLGEEPILVEEDSRIPQIGIGTGPPPFDPYCDPNDPRYEPNNPRCNPNDPRYDPNDPRYRDQVPPGSTIGRPGIVLNPGGIFDSDSVLNERKLIAVDFRNKAHTTDPVIRTLSRDRFLYFTIPEKPATKEGIILILPAS